MSFPPVSPATSQTSFAIDAPTIVLDGLTSVIEAADKVLAGYLSEARLYFRAITLCLEAAWVEAAPCRYVDWTGYFSVKNDFFPFNIGMRG